MNITEHLLAVKKDLPASVQLVAVSKYHPEEEILDAYHAGQRTFGENIVQELRLKQEHLPKDIEWHFIGHLQRNKVKYLAPFISLIHSIDSAELMVEIDRQARRFGRQIPVLLQVHLAQEETKFGFLPEECLHFLDEGTWKTLEGVRIDGLMTMASNVDDNDKIRSEFHHANELYHTIKSRYFSDSPHFRLRSWGMSGDYKLAIEEGSNMIRVGSLIFGPRPARQTINEPI